MTTTEPTTDWTNESGLPYSFRLTIVNATVYDLVFVGISLNDYSRQTHVQRNWQIIPPAEGGDAGVPAFTIDSGNIKGVATYRITTPDPTFHELTIEFELSGDSASFSSDDNSNGVYERSELSKSVLQGDLRRLAAKLKISLVGINSPPLH